MSADQLAGRQARANGTAVCEQASAFGLEIYRIALERAQTPEEQVWALAAIGQAAALNADTETAVAALRRALELLSGEAENGVGQPRGARNY